jgi:superfamily II DNA or RNA helicase
MSVRDERQREFAEKWLKSGKHGILNLCPRFGKIRTSILIFDRLQPKSILIAYPDNKIKDSWKAEFEIMGFDDSNVTYTTHLSLKKYVDEQYDIVVLDEIHLLSEAQMEACKELLKKNKQVLGLTGTLSSSTEETLGEKLQLVVVGEYSIELAIEEGVIVDYEIVVHTVSLDNVVKNNYKGKFRTEKQQFDAYSWSIEQAERQYKNTMFLRLARMRIIQNSLAKRNYTKKLLEKYFKDERVLVFCGVTKIADSLGIPSYHSKSTEKDVFTDFAEGKGNHLAVVKIGNTGVTYKPLNRLIINYFDSNAENLAQKINRCMAFEYNNLDKKAYIHIVCTNETTEIRWLNKALEFFDKSKVKFVSSSIKQ